jgi:hypothetical protein
LIARTARQFPVIVALVAVLALAPIALAGKGGKPGGGGGGGGGGTISLAPLVWDANGNGLPNWADIVVFNISTTATSAPYVNLQCVQNGVVVLNGWNGYFVGALNNTWDFGLQSGAWQGGAATCTAYLDSYGSNGRWTRLASTSFSVGA